MHLKSDKSLNCLKKYFGKMVIYYDDVLYSFKLPRARLKILHILRYNCCKTLLHVSYFGFAKY